MHDVVRRTGYWRVVAVFSVLLFILLVGSGTTPPVKSAAHIVQAPVWASALKLSMHLMPVRIMPLGDSLTAGTKSTTNGGYRVYLWNDFNAVGWSVEFVGSLQKGPATLPDRHNEGHGGWRIDQISAHITNWLTTYSPQVILLHIGTNDIIQGYSVATAIKRLKLLLTQITSEEPDAVLLVAQIIPLRKPVLDAKVRQYNSAIPAIVNELVARGKRVASVDMYDAVSTSVLVDGIHPNDGGYALMANVWFRMLQLVM